MHRFLCLILLIGMAWSLEAAAPPKPNTLTPKEIADGWIMLFDGESTYGWTALGGSKWTVANGMLAPQKDNTGVLLTTTAFGNYELDFYFQAKTGGQAQLVVGCDETVKPQKLGDGGVLVSAEPGFDAMHLNSVNGSGWQHATLMIKNGRIVESSISGFSGGTSSKSGVSTDKARTGRIALAGNGFVIRNLRLKPLDQKPLFNGKDLTGWKVFPGDKYKSKFTVTPEGWLNIKNGPGDLQTEGQWADFVLQLECISNGEHLNSGAFFRCIPDQYQQGYEAQIRNQFTAEPTQEYVVEEYDPMTNQLKDKKKVQSTAVDYGTGAVYRRQPARRAASKDGEWFTLTVVADGRHIATWVNGVQVTDWTDNRPLNANARNGCHLEKGPISLQGHDPTTDLSFRNFRIAELPTMEKK